MRLSKRSCGAFTSGLAALAASWLGLQGCTQESTSKSGAPQGQAQEALSRETSLVPWGNGLAFLPGGRDARASGPEAIAFGAGDSRLLVLDTVSRQILRVSAAGDVQRFADVPADANGLAVSPEGEVAVHRAVSLSVPMYSASGRALGSLAVPSGARDADVVRVLAGGRVMLEHPFQERYLLGSVVAPREPEVVVPSRREGLAEGFQEVGYAVEVSHPDGDAKVEPEIARLGRPPARAGSHAYLLARVPVGKGDDGSLRYESKRLLDLGEATAATIVGVVRKDVCVVIEHVDLGAERVQVKREVVVASASDGAGRVGARFEIETSDVYTMRQEFAYDGRRLVQALPTREGLKIQTIALAEVSP